MKDIAELETALKDLEDLALGKCRTKPRKLTKLRSESYIDAIVISHEFTDHCNRNCLEQCHPGVPVFATAKAAELVRTFNHFHTIITIPPYSPRTLDWRQVSRPPLPRWLSIARVVSEGDGLYYHSAGMVAFDLRHPAKPGSGEAVFYAPHGIKANDLEHIGRAHPKIGTLAMLHGLDDVGIRMTKQLNLGAYNGLRAVRILQAKYWVTTHDEVKKGNGLISPFLRRERITLRQALEKEDMSAMYAHRDSGLQENGIQFADLGSGESMLLE